ncbi:MAG TPA: hypothetical protein VFW00_07800 [Rhodocyclaceae bacterium]|nr:hypothetical protein [Rhodocyclaceae bacterium]
MDISMLILQACRLCVLLCAVATFVPSARCAEIDSARISQLANALPATPAGFGPPCSDRGAWDNAKVAERLKMVISGADKLLAQQFPAWSDDAYLEYSRKGTRPNGERMMNARKAWLYPLVLAECVEDKGRYLSTIEQVLTQLDMQPTWTWPAHDTKLRNFHDHNYEVDLMAADTAHDVAQTLYMLGDKLSPAIRAKTMATMEARIFAPLRRSFAGSKDNWWLQADHNWNAVCLTGSVSAALAVLPSKQDRAMFAAAAEHYIRNYVSGFSDDGYTSEGPGYWNYGFSHFTELREALMQVTSGRLDLFGDPKVRKMSLYGVRIEMMPGNVAAFGDASRNTKMDNFSRAYANQVFALNLPLTLANISITTHPSANADPLANAALVLFGQPAPIAASNTTTANSDTQIGLRSFFDVVGVLVARPAPGSVSKLAVSIKAGGNGNHSHNDIGSYTIALGNEQPTGDVGKTEYSSKTFSKDRYTIKGINSWGHPVPVVAGALQLEATRVKPKVLATNFTPQADEITIDLAPAYAVSALKSLTRTMRYERSGAGAVQIDDRFEFASAQSFEVALTTAGNWRQQSDGSVELWQKNEHLLAHVEASGPWDLIAENVDEEGLAFTRIGIRLRTPQASGFVRVRFAPIM